MSHIRNRREGRLAMIGSKKDDHTVGVLVLLQFQSFQCFFGAWNKNRQSDNQNIYVRVLYKYEDHRLVTLASCPNENIRPTQNQQCDGNIRRSGKVQCHQPLMTRAFLPFKIQLIPAVLHRNKTIKYMPYVKHLYIQYHEKSKKLKVPPVLRQPTTGDTDSPFSYSKHTCAFQMSHRTLVQTSALYRE